MAQQVKVLAVKPNNLSSLAITHFHKQSSRLQASIGTLVCVYSCTHAHSLFSSYEV